MVSRDQPEVEWVSPPTFGRECQQREASPRSGIDNFTSEGMNVLKL